MYNELIESCLKHDKKAQELLFKTYYGKMLNICYRYTNDIDDAKDLLQEGFIKVFDNIHKYENNGSLEGWIKRIIRNNAIDHIRRKKYIFDDIENIPELVDEKIEVFENLKAKTLINLINKLSPAYKTVFNLYVMEDYTHKEIANILNISPNTSKSNYKKAKAKLLKMYNI